MVRTPAVPFRFERSRMIDPRPDDPAAPAAAPFRLSVVMVVHDDAGRLGGVLDRLVPVLSGVTADYELLVVDDGSRDGSAAVVRRRRAANPTIKLIELGRRFGHEVALAAGLEYATGAAAILIDIDLGAPPELIPELVDKWRDGHDLVVAVAGSIELRRPIAEWLFGRRVDHLLEGLCEVPLAPDHGEIRLLDRSVIEQLKRLPERTRYLKGLFAWLGLRPATVTYFGGGDRVSAARALVRRWFGALDGLVSATTYPLRLWARIAGFVAGLAVAYGLGRLVLGLFGAAPTEVGGAEFSLLVLVLGLLLAGVALVGAYVARIMIEVKARPLYFVRRTVGFGLEPEDADQIEPPR